MATPETEEYLSAPEDLERFALSQSYFQMTQSASWKDLLEKLDLLIAQAQQDHFSSRETDAFKIIEEKLRWQQRVLIRESINALVQSQLKVREEILEELKQGDVNEY